MYSPEDPALKIMFFYRFIRKFGFLFALVLFLLVASDKEAQACRCVPASFDSRWRGADTIFIGTVKEIEILHRYLRNTYEDRPAKVVFDVDAYYKGGSGEATEFRLDEPLIFSNAQGEQTILEYGYKRIPQEGHADAEFFLHTSLQNMTCMGYPFREGETYLVFAYLRVRGEAARWSLYHYPSGTYGVGGLCGGTMPKSHPSFRHEISRILAASDKKRANADRRLRNLRNQ
ncbi:MAG: hypothetical protein EA357_04015 [Micavibrio sp.]|nr:MAG: hypothetical protein EA357_04015 [Micavibrio sp.]